MPDPLTRAIFTSSGSSSTLFTSGHHRAFRYGAFRHLASRRGGMVFEMLADIPGEYVFVNHGFGHGQKGAIGILSVES